MAVVTLNPSTFTQVTAAATATLVQFRAYGTGAIEVAASASPAASDWIVFGSQDMVRFPAGTPVYARGTGVAVTRAFE